MKTPEIDWNPETTEGATVGSSVGLDCGIATPFHGVMQLTLPMVGAFEVWRDDRLVYSTSEDWQRQAAQEQAVVKAIRDVGREALADCYGITLMSGAPIDEAILAMLMGDTVRGAK